jgi:tetraacyldisaccharide 4'-kinase
MREAVQRAWLRRGPLAWALLPMALLFGLAGALRRGLYGAGVLRSTSLPVPVIVVGNVVAGGAGKTPVILALLEHLRARGLRAGVVSRGYGRQGSATHEVREHDTAAQAGDEPLLIRRRAQVPVFVAARRATAAQALLAAHPQVQVLLSDDGLQHLALARDIEICVFDERGTGNGWLLPAGPLREPWPRQVDLVLRPDGAQDIAGHVLRRSLAAHAVRADGVEVPLAQLHGQPAHAVAGIANPEPFFRMLREAGLDLASCTGLPDHYGFEGAAQLAPAGAVLLCTEKDAVKLWRTRPDAWAVPLRVDTAPAFWNEFDRLLDARLSSPHGPQTA